MKTKNITKKELFNLIGDSGNNKNIIYAKAETKNDNIINNKLATDYYRFYYLDKHISELKYTLNYECITIYEHENDNMKQMLCYKSLTKRDKNDESVAIHNNLILITAEEYMQVYNKFKYFTKGGIDD